MEICAYCEAIKDAAGDGEAAVVQEIADLFYQAVWRSDDEVYNAEQKAVWAPKPDYVLWHKRLADKQPWLAKIDQRIAGFIELDPDGHIDCTYTHPDYQGQGVASALYQQLELTASNRDLQRLYVEASIIAQPFFQRWGFSVVKENIIQRDGVTLSNFTMEKLLK